MDIIRIRKTIIASTILAATVAEPALAHGGRGTSASRPAGVSIQHAGGLLGQLIFPCQAACVSDAQDCVDTANATALDCVSTACSTEITAAQTACAESRSSTECKTAVSALADCGESCLDTRATSLTTCRETLNDCRDACESDE
jgi:hypothetical protein